MLICIDYDKTYTLDKSFWNDFIELSKKKGNSIICCSMRHEETEGKDLINDLNHRVDSIFFTGRIAKAKYLQSIGIKPDIWIDDSPHWINMDSF